MEQINSIRILENMKVSELKKGHTIRDLKISELKSLARSYGIRSIYKLNKDNLITNINKQQPFRKFKEDIFKTDNSSLNNNPFQNSLEKTPEVFELIDVIQLNKQVQKKFKIHETDYKIRFKEALIKDLKLCNAKYKIDYTHKALDSMLKLAQKNSNYEKGDQINIIVMNPNLKNTISTGMKSDNFLTNLKSIVGNILTSDETIDITETTFQVQLVKIPRGSNRTKIINLSENIKTKNSIFQINNDDNLCCPRAIVVALSTQTNNILGHELDSNKIKQLKIGRKIQKDLALELCNMLTEYNEEDFTLTDIKNVERTLDIQINIICAENLNTLIYKGDDKQTKIYLYKNGNHFDVIKSAKGFYGSSYYCEDCDKPYQNKDKHKCVEEYNICKMCTYFGIRIEHSSILRDKKHKHKCGYSECRNCLEEVKINKHQCYMQHRSQKGAQQETGTHIANKIIAHDFEGNKIMFDTNEEFCKHVISEEYRGYTFIAHYAKGYDSQFILKYLVDNTLRPFTIYNGTKLMLLEIKYLSIRIIDSSNFIQSPLSSFPKTFGLKELKKGYFPHFFNTVENQNYIGILPDKEYYGYETMKTENKQEFEKWYNDKINENYIFNFKEELEAYYKEKNEKYSKQSITWLQHFNNKNISHALNGGAKVDGFDNKSKTVYQYHGCFWHGCTKCYKDRETINNINHETMEDLYQKTIDRNNGGNVVKTGTMLGEWTDELGENVHITDWASTGPKNRIPIVIYADFECFLKPVNNITSNKTKNTHYHKPMIYGLYVKIDYNIVPIELIKKFKIPRKPIIYR
ncbi:hypothetical protein AGLY_016657, partial [Aphis glycines]